MKLNSFKLLKSSSALWNLFLKKHPEYIEENILARITEPERVISFRVPWVDHEENIK